MLKRVLKNRNVGKDLSPVVLLALVAIFANCSRSATPKPGAGDGAGGEGGGQVASAKPADDKSTAVLFPPSSTAPTLTEQFAALVDSGDFKVVLQPQSFRIVSPTGTVEDLQVNKVHFSINYLINRIADGKDVSQGTLTGALKREGEKRFASDFLTISGGRQARILLDLETANSGNVTAQIRESANANNAALAEIRFPYAPGSLQFSGNIAFTILDGANPEIMSIAVNSLKLKQDTIERMAFSIPYNVYKLGSNEIGEQLTLEGVLRRDRSAAGETYVSFNIVVMRDPKLPDAFGTPIGTFQVVLQMPVTDYDQIQLQNLPKWSRTSGASGAGHAAAASGLGRNRRRSSLARRYPALYPIPFSERGPQGFRTTGSLRIYDPLHAL